MFRKILVFLILLSLWFFSSILWPYDSSIFLFLNVPKLFLPNIMIDIIWILIYILNTISIYIMIKNYELENNYFFILIINYIFNQLFSLFFFYFHYLYLSLICTTITAVSSFLLYIETKKSTKTFSFLLIPYVLWSFLALIYFIIIFIIN